MKELRLRREKSQPKTPSTDSIWDASSISEEIAAKKMKPEFDLAKNFSLARINSMSIDGTPQSVCRNTNENLDLTYVTDVLNNKIWMFAGFIHKGKNGMLKYIFMSLPPTFASTRTLGHRHCLLRTAIHLVTTQWQRHCHGQQSYLSIHADWEAARDNIRG